MFAMKVVDPKDAKLKASLEAEGNSKNGGLENPREGKSCAKCDKTFWRNFELETHMVKIYGHVKQHSCEICNKRFFIKLSLNKHSSGYEKSAKLWKYFAEETVL